jgi:hypothetical protein
MRTDDRGVVGVPFREEVVEDGFIDQAIGPVLRNPMRSLSSQSASSSWLEGTVSK